MIKKLERGRRAKGRLHISSLGHVGRSIDLGWQARGRLHSSRLDHLHGDKQWLRNEIKERLTKLETGGLSCVNDILLGKPLKYFCVKIIM